MKNHKKLIIIAAIVILLGIGSYFAYKKLFPSELQVKITKYNDLLINNKKVFPNQNTTLVEATIHALTDSGLITPSQASELRSKIDDITDTEQDQYIALVKIYADSIMAGKTHTESMSLIK